MNIEELKINLDLLGEARKAAHLKVIACKQRATRKYNTKVILRCMKEGDLVLKRPIKDLNVKKLGPN